MKRPLLLCAILTVLSLIVYYYFGLQFFLCALLVSVAVTAFLIKRIGYIIITFLLFVGLFVSVKTVKTKTDSSFALSGEKYTIDCVVVSDEVQTENAFCVTIKALNNSDFYDNTKYNLYYRNERLDCGQKLTVNVNFFEFDENSKYLINKDIYGTMWLSKIVSHNGEDLLYSIIGKTRDFIKNFLARNLSYESSNTITAILLGDKSYLDDDFSLCVRKAGVSHIMAVSGMHLSIILGFLFFLFSTILKNKYLKFLFSVISAFSVSAICGFTPSVVRAGLMFLIFAFAPLINKDTDVLSVISFAVVIILVKNPMLLFNISFEMSVLAIIAVIYVAPFYLDLLFKILPNNMVLKVFVSALLVSTLANIFTMPIAIYNFNMVSIVSVLTNILISIPTTLAIEMTMTSIVLSFIAFVSKIIMCLVDVIAKYINLVIYILGNLKYSSVNVKNYMAIYPIFLIVLLIAFKEIYERRGIVNGNNK